MAWMWAMGVSLGGRPYHFAEREFVKERCGFRSERSQSPSMVAGTIKKGCRLGTDVGGKS